MSEKIQMQRRMKLLIVTVSVLAGGLILLFGARFYFHTTALDLGDAVYVKTNYRVPLLMCMNDCGRRDMYHAEGHQTLLIEGIIKSLANQGYVLPGRTDGIKAFCNSGNTVIHTSDFYVFKNTAQKKSLYVTFLSSATPGTTDRPDETKLGCGNRPGPFEISTKLHNS